MVIAIAVVVLGSLVVTVTFLMRRQPPPAEITTELKMLTGAVTSFNNSLGLLEDFSTDYLFALEKGGFTKLSLTRKSLKRALDLTVQLVRQGDNEAAWDILRWLSVNGGKGATPAYLQERFPEDIEHLTRWKARSRETVVKLIEEMSKSSEAYKEIGRVRAGNRAPTSVMLRELRNVLAEIL